MRNNMTPITYKGETLSILEWSRRTGIRYSTLQRRLGCGWPPEVALTHPYGKRFNKHTLTPFGVALLEYQRDLHAQHRALHRSIRAFVADVERQMAGVRHQLDRMVDEQINSQASNATPGVVADFLESAPDQSLPSTQDSV